MDFVIIANAWTAANDNPTGKHQIALQLAEKGHRVLWIEGSGMRKPSAGSRADRSRIMSKLKTAAKGIRQAEPNIWRVAPLIIPMPTQPIVRALNSIIYICAGCIGKLFLRFKQPTLINFLPIVPLSEKLWPWQKIYFCVDRWDKFDMYDTRIMGAGDSACCRNADVVLTTSHDLQTRCKKKNPHSFLIGHGVNLKHFSSPLHHDTPRPAELPEGKIIGFFGLLSEWVDLKLITELAKALQTIASDKSASIVLIGRADVDISQLEPESNIHILGPKTFAKLPDYTAFFDVSIIPFIINDLTVAVNPIKLREMLAAGCPVVSTALPEVSAIAKDNPYAETAENSSDFITAVIKHLDNNLTSQERKTISDTMRNETWSSKVDLILKTITQVQPHNQSAAP